jgi:hypothetical protein
MSETILQRAVELAWRHWTLVGVRGTAPAPRYPIDLEALIAFTPFVAASDPRLRDESRDWCARIGRDFVSLSRLRQVIKLVGPPGDEAHGVQLDLFEGAAAPAGYATGKSRVPELGHPALLQLRARSLFGVGTRADVLAHLAVSGRDARRLTAPQIRPTGCTKQAVAAVLDGLVRGHLLRKVNGPTGILFEVVREEALRSLLDPVPSAVVDWAERFALVALVLRMWREFGHRATYGIELMKALKPSLGRIRSATEPLRLVGRPPEIVSEVERWAVDLLDDEAWEDAWLFRGEDVAHDILLRIHDDLVAVVQEGDYPVGYTELDALSFRSVDRTTGTAQFSVDFDGEHPREEFSFTGHVAGTLKFDPNARRKETFIDSVEVEQAQAHFDLDDPD